jgi:5'(3')-deoxyribonucleotidase
MEFRHSLEDKYDWLLQHFPFIHWKNYVFCGDKSIIGADYMIDDHVFNLQTFRGKGLLFTASHNIHETDFTRVNDWQEVRAFFQAERQGTK